MKQDDSPILAAIVKILDNECGSYMISPQGHIHIPLYFAPVLTRILFQSNIVSSVSFTKSFDLHSSNEDIVPFVRISYL